MQYTYKYIAARIGEKGYLDLVAVFEMLGFKNVQDIPEMLWAAALRIYEEKMFRNAA